MQPSKIVVAGLEEAGKTSLLISLEKKFDYIPEVKKLTPTTGVHRSKFTFLNREIVLWDFGGQSKYRQDYLSQKDRYFTDMEILFFVIDVQAQGKFTEAVEYFAQIMQYLAGKKNEIPIVILLHKFDPQLSEDISLNNHVMNLKELVVQSSGGAPVDFFTTSIYDIDSIMRAFSQPLARILPRSEMLVNLLEEISTAHACVAMLLMDANGIMIADYYRPHLGLLQRNAIRELRINALKKIIEKGVGSLRFEDEEYPERAIFGEIRNFPEENPLLYLLLLSENKKTITIDIEGILPRLEKVLWEIMKAEVSESKK